MNCIGTSEEEYNTVRQTKKKKINSKQKGARFERTIANLLKQDYGYECRRGQQYCGANGDADVVGLKGIHIEAKHQERMQLYDWMAQAKGDARKGEIPVVIHKRNNCEILVTMTFDGFMQLYRDWEGGAKDETEKPD